MSAREKELLRIAINPSSVVVRGKYTDPKTWGVYEVSPSQRASSTRRFRFGNHPIRQHELVSEFSDANLVALFLERAFAEELAHLLNSGDASVSR